MKNFIVVSLFLFLVNGCANHTSPEPEVKTPSAYTESEQNGNDGFMDEFDDEFTEKEKVSDPLIVYNRSMTTFNDKAYLYIIKPVSQLYAAIMPEFLRLGISNAYHNIKFPVRFTNTLLQLKLQGSMIELERFIVNSTIGLAGLMDPAEEHMGLEPQEEDFGQTLGVYGVGPGFHLVLPLIGPSNIRDTIGLGADSLVSPLIYTKNMDRYKIPDNYPESAMIWAVDKINYNSLHLGEYESAKKDAVDWYIFLRNAYEKERSHSISQ
ncbi:MAG: VacJ family lipoprotein [Sulfurimonas sp.]